MPICEECNKYFDSQWAKVCPACRAKDRETDMAVGDKGR